MEQVNHAELRRVFDKQHENRWRISQTSADERIAKLARLRDAIMSRREELHAAIHADFRKNPGETDITEVFPVISEINHTIKHLHSWMKPKRVKTPLVLFGTRGEVHYEAKGVVLILSPWNYPFHLLFNPIVTALSAGNCVIVKPSSKVPNTSHFVKKFLGELFNESEVAVFEGSSAISDALLDLPFDHIFFTGSPRIGKSVMAAAAKHLTPVTLELGGKSPVIIDESADLKTATRRLMWGKFINAGQTCVAPDYLLIHESKLEAFLSEAQSVLSGRFGSTEEERKASGDFCRLVSQGHHAGLIKVLEETIRLGAKAEVGWSSDAEERFLSPTILTGVREDSAIMQEEIFGPILPVITFKDIGEAIRIIQSKEKPLALYIFSLNKATVENILRNTTSGGTCVNSVVIHLANPDLPFGGVGNSGMGNYHGFFGFRQLSHERAVLYQGWPDILKFFYPPYTKFVRKLIAFATRWLS